MGLKDFVIRRGVETVLILFIMITFNFFLFRVMPGDPTSILVGNPHITQEARLRMIHDFGLDKPLLTQFVLYIKSLFKGDLGISFYYTGEQVAKVIFGRRIVNTLILMGSSTALSIVFGIVLGAVSAWKRGTKQDITSMSISLALYSTPTFWLGMMILLVFGYYFNLIPMSGTITPALAHANILHYIADYLHHLIGPTVTLTLIFYGGYYLLIRNTMLDVLAQDYIQTVRAKGASDRTIIFHHAARNAMLPMVSIIAINIALMVGGAIVTETVFSWYGIGRLMYNSVMSKDYPVLQAIFLVLSLMVLIANFVADIVYGYLDPRVRY